MRLIRIGQDLRYELGEEINHFIVETAQVVEANGVFEQTPFFAISGNALDQFLRVSVELKSKSD